MFSFVSQVYIEAFEFHGNYKCILVCFLLYDMKDDKFILVSHKGYHDGILLVNLLYFLGVIKPYSHYEYCNSLKSGAHTFIFVMHYDTINHCFKLIQTFDFSGSFYWDSIHHLMYHYRKGINCRRMIYFDDCVKFRFKLHKGYNIHEFSFLFHDVIDGYINFLKRCIVFNGLQEHIGNM